MGKWKYEKRAVYSIYKGDDILYTGILDECAEYLKIKNKHGKVLCTTLTNKKE